MKCTNCGNLVAPETSYCVMCGHAIERISVTRPRYCSNCGEALVLTDSYCSNCGTPIEVLKGLKPSKYTIEELFRRCYLCDLPIPSQITYCPRCNSRLTCFKCSSPLNLGKTINHTHCNKCGHKKINKKLQAKKAYYQSLPPLNSDQVLEFYRE